MSVRFDADTDKLTLASAPSGSWSTTGWVWLTTDRNYYQTVIGAFTGTGTYRYLATEIDGTTLTFFGQSSNATGPNMAVGAWYRFGITVVPGGAVTMYYATAAGATSTAAGTSASGTPTTMVLGGSTFGSENLDGRLAYVRVWNAILTQTQIEAEWAATTAVLATNLWADWPLTVHTDLTDHSGNGRNLTAGSTAVTTEADPPLAVTYTKAGSGAGRAAASGPKTVTAATTHTKTGAAARPGAGAGSKTVTSATTHTKTGASAAAPAASGAKSVTMPKAGGGVATAAGSGNYVRTFERTGAAATSTAAVGSKVVTAAATYTKTGAASATVAASGASAVTHPATHTGTGSAATGVAGSGSVVVDTSSSTSVTGSAAARAMGGGTREVTLHRAGSATVGAASAGSVVVEQPGSTEYAGSAAAGVAASGAATVTSASIHIKTGGGVARVAASGFLPAVAYPYRGPITAGPLTDSPGLSAAAVVDTDLHAADVVDHPTLAAQLV